MTDKTEKVRVLKTQAALLSWLQSLPYRPKSESLKIVRPQKKKDDAGSPDLLLPSQPDKKYIERAIELFKITPKPGEGYVVESTPKLAQEFGVRFKLRIAGPPHINNST
ncbi:hypothetical protein CN311_16120 [Mesorhizobium sanjuanii]|uniref:Uncharacterized protein n=1 Tax=Mesorhizobium sanjuanii TaxID=2037900 RepID=A0A2A6FEP3_9HYPH|nr:hypothetical protein [Mesorhizobium sanjuanii]PDQ20091.1 hypothetical protein CN311_16120 [Mesorhizobium sanjuanii]